MRQAAHTPKRNKTQGSRESRSSTRASIISTAYDLFQERGYAKTSISELARRVGIDPSTLYYYFPSKEALLAELASSKVQLPTLEELTTLSGSAAEQLYALIMLDVVQKCGLSLDFIDVESAARSKPENFQEFFEQYRNFYQTLVGAIERGKQTGEFISCSPEERGVTILSINEGLQHHFHAKVRGQLLLEESGYTVRDYSPEGIGHLSAQSVVPSLVAKGESFDEIALNGRKLYSLIMSDFKTT